MCIIKYEVKKVGHRAPDTRIIRDKLQKKPV